MFPVFSLAHGCGSFGAGIFENIHEFPITTCDLGECRLASDLLGAHVDQWTPETGAPYSESDEAIDCGCSGEPLPHLLIVLSTAEDDAADFLAMATARHGHNLFAVFATVESFDLPNVRLDLRVLELQYGF